MQPLVGESGHRADMTGKGRDRAVRPRRSNTAGLLRRKSPEPAIAYLSWFVLSITSQGGFGSVDALPYLGP